MDTVLSSSVSALKVPTLHSTTSSRELTHLKTNNTASYSSNNLLYTKPNNSSSISNKTASKHVTTQTFLSSSLSSSPPLSSSPSLSPSPSALHRNPATGYAVALLDIAQHSNSVDLVGKDVERLLKLLRNKRIRGLLSDHALGEREKGQVVKDVLVGKGGFNKHLVRLVTMLVGKSKSGIVKRVLEEFERIYDEMLGTQVVLISSAKRMKEDEIFGIAKRVQKISGALRVKVKNLVHEDSLSFVHV